MKITIFGATGGIGRQTVELAKKAGYEAITADISQSVLATDLKGDLMDKEYISQAIKDSDIVVATIRPSLDTSKELIGKTPIADGISNLMDVMISLGKKD